MRTFAVIAIITGVSLAGGGPALAQHAQPSTHVQQPGYACSVAVRQGADRDLSSLAKVTLLQAIRSAKATVAGKTLAGTLDDENGCLVYSVAIRSADGQVHDVKVDAGTGAVVHQEVSAHQGTDYEGPGEGEHGAEDGR